MPTLWDTRYIADPELGTTGDWALAGLDELDNVGGLESLDPLGTAIIIALFSDRRIPNHMLLRYGFTKADQREWHGNTFGVEDGEEPLGSWLWLLRRAALNEQTARLAEHFAALALQTLVRQKVVAGFQIDAEVDKVNGRIGLRIQVLDKDKQTYFADLYTTR